MSETIGQPMKVDTPVKAADLTDDDRRRAKFGLEPAQKADAQNQPGAYPEGSPERQEATEASDAAKAEQDKASGERYQAMKGEDLRGELLERNARRESQGLVPFPLSGSKSDLIARLVEDDATDPAQQ